ncbi:glycerophosphoryl diester phosphodiesterase membrane domain-containing protein [Streptomyces roseolilacinus]|uniref:Membrane protein n=1 Tax=Streptomyces roseolilacinus TaxID=66904 RepID=A0A918B5Q5_9ACTN|nr:glycerophosphoryl diester phosphodiesterase membrane domain-containing protein [Streptomyces roseolilacinus]GGQ30319.1 membrane protein [Streptomyces roseolilacinus]
MNDSPGWASPGSPSPSDDQGAGASRPSGEQGGPAPQWSENQPPPGRWSPPAAQPGGPVPPAPGWGGGGPYGGWAQPPAPKPGVIPLRPLGVGEILDGAVSTLRAHWRTVLGITLTVSVVVQLVQILLQRYVLPQAPALDPNASPSEVLEQAGESLRVSMISAAPSMLLGLTATFVTTALLTFVVSRSVLGRPVTFGDVWRDARPRLVPLLGLTLLLPLIVLGITAVGVGPGLLIGSVAGAVLVFLGGLAAVLVVVWLTVRFSLSYSVVMLEGQGVGASLRRSAKLVRGSWWRIFGILLLTALLTALIAMIVAIPFTMLALAADGEAMDSVFSGGAPQYSWTFLIVSGIGAVITSAIMYPISAGVTVLLYVDQRIRREALDLELARAAGVPGYGSASPGDTTPRS